MINHVLLHSFSQILDLLLIGRVGSCIAAFRSPFFRSRPTDKGMTAAK
jgi:hypothetical protein